MEVKRNQPNEGDIVPSGRNPKEITKRAKGTKMKWKPMLYTHKTMSGVSVTKRWAKEKYDLTKTKLDVTPTQGETVALLQGERQPICALALFRSLHSHTLAYKLESVSFDGRHSFWLFSLFFWLFSSLLFTIFLSSNSQWYLNTHTLTMVKCTMPRQHSMSYSW